MDFVWNDAEFRALIRGPVMGTLVRRAIRVVAAAQRNATDRPGPRVISGTLRRSITYWPSEDTVSPYVDVGSAVRYAKWVEDGHENKAHAYPIFTPGGTFTGMYGYVGNNRTPAYPYLRPALEAARAE